MHANHTTDVRRIRHGQVQTMTAVIAGMSALPGTSRPNLLRTKPPNQWLAPIGLIVLSIVPVLAGTFRLTELMGGVEIDANRDHRDGGRHRPPVLRHGPQTSGALPADSIVLVERSCHSARRAPRISRGAQVLAGRSRRDRAVLRTEGAARDDRACQGISSLWTWSITFWATLRPSASPTLTSVGK